MEAPTPASFEAIDAAIDRIVTISDNEVEAGVRDAAVSALTLMLGRLPVD
jgi:threonine dehydratase